MSSLKETITLLEADLTATPMRHTVYHDMPYALFCYPPAEEWAFRREVDLLRTRVHNATGRHIVTVSLAALLWQAIDESEGMDELVALERREGFAAAQRQVQGYLSEPDWRPLADLLAERLAPLDANRHLAFIQRAGALAPNLYRVSRLLDELKGRTRVPSVLFMPATVLGGTVSYMGIADNEGRGSYHTKVYACEASPGVDGPLRTYPLREVFSDLRWMVRVGASWRMIPHALPPWHVVSGQAQRRIAAGAFEVLAHDQRTALHIV